MLALTLKQPWATAIVKLGKDVENRSWTTPFRGELAIHAGKSVDPLADLSGYALSESLPSGCVVAVVELRDVVRDSTSEWARDGHYHWVLSDVHPLALPIPCMGRLNLFKLPVDVEEAVKAALVPRQG